VMKALTHDRSTRINTPLYARVEYDHSGIILDEDLFIFWGWYTYKIQDTRNTHEHKDYLKTGWVRILRIFGALHHTLYCRLFLERKRLRPHHWGSGNLSLGEIGTSLYLYFELESDWRW
jgi:hypothetical protein